MFQRDTIKRLRTLAGKFEDTVKAAIAQAKVEGRAEQGRENRQHLAERQHVRCATSRPASQCGTTCQPAGTTCQPATLTSRPHLPASRHYLPAGHTYTNQPQGSAIRGCDAGSIRGCGRLMPGVEAACRV
eukprot:4817522-Prymnesium_polylepis.1